jgi:hypothetical protein
MIRLLSNEEQVFEEGVLVDTEGKKEKRKEKWWNSILAQLLLFLSQIFIGLVLTGMVLYVMAQYKLKTFQPFELATVAGLLGGFPIVAAFVDKGTNGLSNREKEAKKLNNKLKVVGGLYTFSAIMFVVFGFYLAADQANLIPSTGQSVWIFQVIYIVTFYGGALTLVFGMWTTLELIPQLVGLGSFIDRARKIFKRNKK